MELSIVAAMVASRNVWRWVVASKQVLLLMRKHQCPGSDQYASVSTTTDTVTL